MNLFLRPLTDVNDPVWSVIFSIVLLLAGVFYIVAYILGIDEKEHGSNDTTEQEELLQLPSSGDQQSSGRGHD
jgi:hypothetical protein